MKNGTKFSGQFVISLLGEFRYFSQSKRRQKQQKEPCHAADIPAVGRPQKPPDTGDHQHNKRGEAPAVIGRTGVPRASQNEQRRNDRQEKKNVIEIHREMRKPV